MDRSKQALLRAQAFKRDNGVCSVCKLNCVALERIQAYCRRRAGGLIERGDKPWQYVNGVGVFEGLFQKKHQSKWLKQLLIKYPWIENEKTLWEADHMVPLVLGGENHLDNMRTLCLRCHREVTQKLLRELGRAR